MSRNIPPVRQWRVRFYCDKILLAEITVETINKMFARWLARDHFMVQSVQRYMAHNRVTVSLVQHTQGE